MEAIEAHGILRKRLGVLVHDCWAPYSDDLIPVSKQNSGVSLETPYFSRPYGRKIKRARIFFQFRADFGKIPFSTWGDTTLSPSTMDRP
jgi:hypothetical protein